MLQDAEGVGSPLPARRTSVGFHATSVAPIAAPAGRRLSLAITMQRPRSWTARQTPIVGWRAQAVAAPEPLERELAGTAVARSDGRAAGLRRGFPLRPQHTRHEVER
jgi:hypothetical protein